MLCVFHRWRPFICRFLIEAFLCQACIMERAEGALRCGREAATARRSQQ